MSKENKKMLENRGRVEKGLSIKSDRDAFKSRNIRTEKFYISILISFYVSKEGVKRKERQVRKREDHHNSIIYY